MKGNTVLLALVALLLCGTLFLSYTNVYCHRKVNSFATEK